MKKFLKWLLITIGVLIIGITIFVVFFLEDILVNKLTNELNHTFHRYYTIQYESITTSVNWNGLSIEIDKPVFKSDTSKHKLNERFPTLFFKSTKLELKNLSIRKLFFTDDLKLDKIKLTKPHLKLILYDSDDDDDKHKVYKKRKRKKKTNLLIDKIDIEDGNIALSNFKDLSDTTFMGYKINSSVENISIKVSKLKKLAYTLNAKNNFMFSVDKAFLKPYKSNYFFYMDSLFLNDKDKIISAKNISATTLKSKMAISKLFEFSKTIAETNVGSFSVHGYDLRELVLQNSIVLHCITLDHIDLDMFKNRKKELDKNREKLLIQEMLTSLPFTIKVDSVQITNSKLYFEIIDHRTKSPVGLYLTDMNVLLTNVNTAKGNTDTLLLKGSGKLLDAANFEIEVLFPNVYETASYYTGYIGPMSFKTINPILSSYSGIQVVDGNIQSILFSGKCEKYENHGSIVFQYNDLSIESRKTDKNGDRKKAKLVSRLGNIILHNSNPRMEGEAPEKFSYYLRREKYRGHVFLLFGGVLEGMKNTLMDKKVQENLKFLQVLNKNRINFEKRINKAIER